MSRHGLNKLYKEEQIRNIRDIATEIIISSQKSFEEMTTIINKTLESERTSIYPDYLTLIRHLGDPTRPKSNVLDLIKHFPKLYPLTDKYSRQQLVAIALGQDPIVNQMVWQKQINQLFCQVNQINKIINRESSRQEYWKTTDLRLIYLDYQIHRMKKTVQVILDENKGTLKEICQKLNEKSGADFNPSNLTTLCHFGREVRFASMKNLPRIIDLHHISSIYSEEDLRLIALGQTPPGLIEEEQRNFLEYRDIIHEIQEVNHQSIVNIYQTSLINEINQPIFNTLEDCLKFIFSQKEMNWSEGINTLSSMFPEQETVIREICGGNKDTASEQELAALRWAIGTFSNNWLTLERLRGLLPGNNKPVR